MRRVQAGELPTEALLQTYRASGTYTDCYVTEVSRVVTHAEFVEAFYNTWLFRIERGILKVAVSRPSSDEDVRLLATGQAMTFAAWTVEGRAPDQLLLCDMHRATRSWLMVAAAGENATRLYFGSAVVPRRTNTAGESKMGFTYRALMGFHKLYSRALLSAARISLLRQPRNR